MRVEVAYASFEIQCVMRAELATGATLEEAIRESGLLARFPEIDLTTHAVGVFGKPRALDFRVADGDRVEIYRPLLSDPKAARRQRAARKAKGS
ncbi:MAG: RnfH family protein [Panacagrimonas sp.]